METEREKSYFYRGFFLGAMTLLGIFLPFINSEAKLFGQITFFVLWFCIVLGIYLWPRIPADGNETNGRDRKPRP